MYWWLSQADFSSIMLLLSGSFAAYSNSFNFGLGYAPAEKEIAQCQ
jgi:hypothetical protein